MEGAYSSCNAPLVVQREDVISAYSRIQSSIVRTPCEVSKPLSDLLKIKVYLKREDKQLTRSYKDRGALNALMNLSPEKKKLGVIAASAGNHALALCTQGALQSVPVTVCMPLCCSQMKYEACVRTGARVIRHGNTFGEAKAHADKLAISEHLTYINGYDHPDIIAGQGTVALEILEQAQDVDAIVVPVGGGGLIAGIATYVRDTKPGVKVIGVQTNICNSISLSLRCGKPTAAIIDPTTTIADGLCVSLAGTNAFEIIKKNVDIVYELSEEVVAHALVTLIRLESCVVEGSAAATLAAAMSKDLLGARSVVLVLSGANIDPVTLSWVLDRGLSYDRRVVHFVLEHNGRLKGLMRILEVIKLHGAEIKSLTTSPSRQTSSIVFAQKVECCLDVMNRECWDKIKAELEKEFTLLSC